MRETADSPIFTQNKHMQLAMVALIICFWVGASIVCTRLYDIDAKVLMADQAAVLAREARNTVNAVISMRDELKAQSERISSSELLRLYAKEQDEDAQPVPNTSKGISSLAGQKDLLRKVLQEFTHSAGFESAAIVNKHGDVLIATEDYAVLSASQQEAVRQAIHNRALRFAPLRAMPEGLSADFALPLQAQLARDVTEAPVGALLVSLMVADRFERYLSVTDSIGRIAALRILQRTAQGWQIASLQGVSAVAASNVPERNAEGHIAFALRKSMLGAVDVYSLGVRVPDSEWWVMASVPAETLQASLRTRALTIGLMGLLVSVVFALLLPLFWWFFVGRHQHTVAKHFRSMYITIDKQKQLLDSINLSLGVGLFMVDKDGTVRYCNNTFCAALHHTENAVSGKTLDQLFPADCHRALAERYEHVMIEKSSTSFEVRLQLAGKEHLHRMTLFPYMEQDRDMPSGVVGTMQDITEFRRRSQRQQRQQAHTLSALVRAIEGLDHYLVGHSHMMQALGVLVARHLRLTSSEIITVETASALSQVGRLALPHSLATKQGRYSEAELAEIRRVPEYAYTILRDIDFETPVPEAVYHMYERMDGSGYGQGLQGDAIEMPARVLGVLNVFCAMTSPRSYHEFMSAEQAMQILRADLGFDQSVVQALHDVLSSDAGGSIFRRYQDAKGVQPKNV